MFSDSNDCGIVLVHLDNDNCNCKSVVSMRLTFFFLILKVVGCVFCYKDDGRCSFDKKMKSYVLL